MNKALGGTLALGLLLAAVGCGGGGGGDDEATPPPTTSSGFSWSLPQGFPTPKESADNPLSTAKVELGRHLFFDLRMSINQTMACASCHQPARAFTDGRPTAVGATGEAHPRNAMSLTNVVYNATFNWANPGLATLHAQALIPIFGEFPLELGWSDHETEILDRFRHDAIYQKLFADAYPGETDPFDADRVAKAIAAFESILISGNSPHDQANAPRQSQCHKRLRLGAVKSCSSPSGWNVFTATAVSTSAKSVNHAGTTLAQSEFHNNGLYNIGGTGDYPLNNRGLWEFTQRPADMGRFRAPTLRNIELTAPYMHDGSIATLEEVIGPLLARRAADRSEGPLAGDGAKKPLSKAS
ncbi:MAG: cytochrome c peroxidase [Candidatus Competibacter sp.]